MKHLLTHFASIINEDDISNVPKSTLESSSIQLALQILFGIAAAVAVLIIAISAMRITISRGNSQDVQKARDAIIYAAIGLAVTMSGFVIVTFVLDRV